jgi:hypothetical protein
MSDAPRFRYMFERVEGTSVLTVRRDDWFTFVGTLGQPVVLDVRSTPISRVTEVSSVVASIAHQFGPANARFSVFRHDPADEPTPINQDEYDVWTDLSQHPRFSEMVAAASSTTKPEDVSAFCEENVFFVKREPGPDHWLPSVPGSVTALFKTVP